MNHKQVLVILPHPDDESFATAGTIMLHKDLGFKVTYLCLTMGEMGRNFGNPPFANRESLPDIRRKELDQACEILGIDNLILYGLRDKTLEFENEEKLALRLKETIEEVNPSIIFTFYPGYSIHPDHDACGTLVVKAVDLIIKDKRPTLYAMAIAQGSIKALGQPDVIFDVKQYSERKMLALDAHKSQMQEVIAVTQQKLKEGNKNTDEWFHFEKFWKIENH